MLKRIRWMLMGMGVGMWAQRRFRRFLRQYTPPEVASRAAARARDEWRAVVAEGRTGMQEREAELRTTFDGRVSAPH